MNFAVDESIVNAMRNVSSRFDLAYWRGVCAEHAFPSEYWKAIARAGLFGILLGEEWGGMGRGIVDTALATEETAERYAGLGSYLYHSGALTPLIFEKNASEQMKRRVLPSLVKGEMRISIALTEDESGLDALAIKTKAKKESGHFVVSGTKFFVTNADRADFLLIFARTKSAKEEERANGLSMFLVDPRDRGIKIRKHEKVGMDFNTLCSLEIKDTKVGSEDLVGTVGEAWRQMREIFEMDRILTAMSVVGTGKLALRIASAHAGKRMVFGKAIGSNQGIQFPLADAMAQLLAAEAVALKASSLAEGGKSYSDWANVALLEAQGAASIATDRALQALGGHGYLRENDVERFWRDARAHRFHPISEEMLMSQIAKRMLGLPGF